MSQTERGKIKVPKIEKRTGRGMWSVECGVSSTFFTFYEGRNAKQRFTFSFLPLTIGWL